MTSAQPPRRRRLGVAWGGQPRGGRGQQEVAERDERRHRGRQQPEPGPPGRPPRLGAGGHEPDGDQPQRQEGHSEALAEGEAERVGAPSAAQRTPLLHRHAGTDRFEVLGDGLVDERRRRAPGSLLGSGARTAYLDDLGPVGEQALAPGDLHRGEPRPDWWLPAVDLHGIDPTLRHGGVQPLEGAAALTGRHSGDEEAAPGQHQHDAEDDREALPGRPGRTGLGPRGDGGACGAHGRQDNPDQALRRRT